MLDLDTILSSGSARKADPAPRLEPAGRVWSPPHAAASPLRGAQRCTSEQTVHFRPDRALQSLSGTVQ